MTKQEALHWLFAIETVANDAGEAGDFELQDDACEWYAAFRDGVFMALSPFNGLQR
jgi:hypothetical protein